MIWNSLIKGSRVSGANQLKRFMSTEAFKLPATGVNKTYDQALEYLTQHSNSKLAQAKKIEEQLKDAKLDQATKSDLQTLKENLLTEAYIHLPETQHKFQTGDYNVTEPVYKYLKTQQWNTELKPIIKQRVEQMFVSPDVLHPQSDYLDSHIKLSVEEGEFVECGRFIDVEKTIQAPTLSIDTFHEATKHYTLIMIDSDHPNQATKSYQQKPHWIIKNVPLSLTQTKVEGETVLNYIPPHPANGTGTHRYAIVLLEQANGDKTELSEFTTGDQALPQFIENNKLTVKGAYFFRSKWSQAVSSIYNDILKIEEPLFGPQPIVNPLVGKDGKLRGRYHNI